MATAFRWLIRAALALAALYLVIAGGLTAFGATAAPPSVMAGISAPIVNQDFSTLPPLARFKARDGAMLAYRRYAGRADRIVILIHGSTGESSNMHTLARKLAPAADGTGEQPTVYALDLRGHGESGKRGDIDYIGQLEDDLEDFVSDRRSDHLGARWSLVGFSSGGGFALRVAGKSAGARYDRIVALAPALHFRAPTIKPAGDLWATPFIPRIIGLSMLNAVGISAFQHLPALMFARRDEQGRPYTYSFALNTNFTSGSDYAVRLATAAKAPVVIVGEKDELFRAEAYGPHLKSIRPDIAVTVLPGLGHMDMTFDPAALQAIALALRGG